MTCKQRYPDLFPQRRLSVCDVLEVQELLAKKEPAVLVGRAPKLNIPISELAFPTWRNAIHCIDPNTTQAGRIQHIETTGEGLWIVAELAGAQSSNFSRREGRVSRFSIGLEPTLPVLEEQGPSGSLVSHKQWRH